MYRAIVRARVRSVFERINRGEWDRVAAGTATNLIHVTPGTHALGGERRSRAAFEHFLRRLDSILPGLRFEVTEVASTGWPWNTWAAAAWVDRTTLRDGTPYENAGVTWINIRWGRVRQIREYMDSELVAAACRRLADEGVEEARLAPLES